MFNLLLISIFTLLRMALPVKKETACLLEKEVDSSNPLSQDRKVY